MNRREALTQAGGIAAAGVGAVIAAADNMKRGRPPIRVSSDQPNDVEKVTVDGRTIWHCSYADEIEGFIRSYLVHRDDGTTGISYRRGAPIVLPPTQVVTRGFVEVHFNSYTRVYGAPAGLTDDA